jgi:hypothetical protein
MQRINQDEYDATHRIFNNVERIVGPYYGRRTWDETARFVSENRWIMFPVSNVESLRDGTVYPLPNVFVSAWPEIQDDGAGRVNGWLGFTYHNVGAMEALYSIIDPRRRNRHLPFLNILSSLDFPIEIQRKTKTDSPNSTPRYEPFQQLDPSTVTTNQIMDAIEESNRTLLRQGDPYPESGNPVIWSVTIFTVIKETVPATFDEDIKNAFGAFQQLLSLA